MKRRGFFQSFASEVASLGERLEGVRQVRLQDLPELPPEVRCQLVPEIDRRFSIVIEDSRVTATLGPDSETRFLFDTGTREQEIFNRFNGRNSLADVSAAFAEEKVLSIEEATGIVEEFFFHLVRQRVCRPNNDLEFDEPEQD